MDDTGLIDELMTLVSSHEYSSALITSIVSFVAGSGIFSFLRRPKTISQGEARYFTDTKLLSPPLARPAYSDRMAYVLAEMSSLAYYEFEGSGGTIRSAAQRFAKIAFDDEEEISKWLETFADELLVKGVDSEAFFRKLLHRSGFELLATVNIEETQAFVCKRVVPGEPPYIVIAYRGTEKKIDDWLTDAGAVPTEKDGVRVHSGFLEALTVKSDSQGKTVLDRVHEILGDPRAKDGDGNPYPMFITGHSLGGALALLTTRELHRDFLGACYTYGAPRVANYKYFKNLKTPVFRVVNSADIVPRLPPGAVMSLCVKAAQGLSWLTGFMPVVSQLFAWLEVTLDKLNGYRHHGDLRYLTDVATGQFQSVELLSNPPAIDRILWMGQHLRASFFAPVKSHGMEIYRKKLHFLANDRNPPA